MSNLIKGYDISVLQGNVNFQAIKTSGAQFVISRCGVGNDGIDSLFSQNIAGTKSAGLFAGCYHFVYPLPATPGQPLRDPVKQAQYHFNASQGVLAFCDLEWPLPSNWTTWGCSASQIAGWVNSYQTEYKSLSGQFPIIYTYPDFVQNLNLPASFGQDYQLWVASYENTPTVPTPWTNWVMWQASGGAETLPGTNVKVDVDYVKDLSLWVPIQSIPAPPISSGSIITVPNAPIPVAPVPPSVNPPVVISVPPIAKPEPTNPTFLVLLWQLISNLVKRK